MSLSSTRKKAGAARLKDEAGIKTAEINPILEALGAHEKHEDYTSMHIFIDSRETVVECRTRCRAVLKIKKIAKHLKIRNCTVRAQWIPGHRDIPGNERVNEVAMKQLHAYHPTTDDDYFLEEL